MAKLISIVLLAMVVSGCNTIHGMGKDLEKAGEAVQKSTN